MQKKKKLQDLEKIGGHWKLMFHKHFCNFAFILQNDFKTGVDNILHVW